MSITLPESDISAAPARPRPFPATSAADGAVGTDPSGAGLAELRRVSGTARVFVSMPWVEGVTPRILHDPERSRAYCGGEALERREGCFAVDEVGLATVDHGVLYGDAAFEGVLIAHGRIFTWREHLARMHQSCARLGISIPYDGVDLTRRLIDAVRQTGVADDERGYIRLVVSRGLGDLGVSPKKCVGSTVYAVCAKIQLYPEAAYRAGIGLSVARQVRRAMPQTLDPRVKSCNYLNNIRALLETLHEGTLETMMLTPDGYVAEATADNLFLVLREPGWEQDPSRVRVVTPSPDYCLNGITRALLMRAAREAGHRVEESATMLPGDWAGPDREAFLTGTGAGVMPVTSVGGVPVGDGRAGPVTQALRERFLRYLSDPALSIPLHATDEEIEAYLADEERPASIPAAPFLPAYDGNGGRAGENFVTELFRKVDARDWDALATSFAPDVVYERPGYEPLMGRERVMRFYREERVIASGQHSLERVVLDEGGGACWGRYVGVHRDGSPIDERFADVYTVDAEGRITTRRSYFYRPAI